MLRSTNLTSILSSFAVLAAIALPGTALAQTSFSFTIENTSAQDWETGVIAVLPEGSSPNALIERGATPVSGDQFATYTYGHANCDTVVTEGDASGLITAFTGLTLDDNAWVVPAIASGGNAMVNVIAEPGEVLSFVAYVSGTTDDVVIGHVTGDNSDATIDLFDGDGLPVTTAGFEITGFDVNSTSSSSGNSSSCSSTCPAPASGCFVSPGSGTAGSGAGDSNGSGGGAFDFDVALWTRTETGFTTDTIAVGDVFDANAGDEIVVLMQGGIYYEGTGSVGAGKTVVLNMDGTLIKTYAPGSGRDIMGAVTIADLDGSSPDEYLIGEALSREDGGSLLAVNANTPGIADPSLMWFQSPRGFPGYWNMGTTIADVTGDSDAEIVSPSFEGVLQILEPGATTATLLDQIDLYAVYGERHYGHAAVADVDGDGVNEIAVAGNTLGQVIVLESDGDPSNTTMTQEFLSDVNSADGVAFGTGPAIANIDDDPELEIIVALTNPVGGTTGYVRAYDIVNGPGTGCEYQWTVTDVQGYRWVSPVVGDVDGDGNNEIVMQGNTGKLSVLSTEGVTTGASCVEATVEATSFVGGSWSWFTPALADLVGDAGVEIIAAGYEVLEVLEMDAGALRVVYRATEPEATFYASPTVTPGIDGPTGPAARITVNGWLNGVIYHYGTQDSDNTPEAWSTFMGNNQRTGTATVPEYIGIAYKQDAGGQGIVSMEAEGFDGNVAQGSDAWTVDSTIAGASSTEYMIALPDDGTNQNTGYAASSPRMDYQVDFVETGTHYVWVRAYRTSATNDSVHAGIDGAENTTADRISNLTQDSWVWTNTTMDSFARATIDVSSTGIHTFNLWMREDGTPVDKIVLTTDPDFTPTGTGPAVSSR